MSSLTGRINYSGRSPLNNLFLVILVLSGILLLTYLTVLVDYKIGVAAVVGVFAVLLLILCLLYPVFGFYLTYFISLFVTLPEKILASSALYTGLIPEFISYVALVGVLTKQKYRKEIQNGFWTKSITIWVVVLLIYYLFQFFNPNMIARLGWFNFVRKQGSFFAFFYITYAVIDSRKALNFLINFWIGVSFFEALYACKQQWFGLADFENTWLMSDKMRIDLFINWGLVRKFGLLSDPAASGVLYASCGLFLLVLALRATKPKRRYFLYLAAIVNLLASSYTGTRTSTMMIVAGILFYGILTLYEKRTMILMAGCVAVFAAIMVVPIYNSPVINRIRSTFEPNKDPSNLVRDMNRKFVQPYIYSHPIGGGIYTCGLLGTYYNPGHFLSNVPPDSGYMQILMDQGYIGLILALAFYFVILRTGIRGFYRTRDPDLKTLFAATIVFIFTLMAGQYSQLAIPMYPSVLFLYSAIAYMIKMNYFVEDKIVAPQERLEPVKP